MSSNAFAARLRDHHGQAISVLARRIVHREIVHVPWQSQLLVPLFQFDPFDLSVREAVRVVIRTLAPACDDWEPARWFAAPADRLGGRRPADLVAGDPAAVIEAARSGGFVVLA